MKTGRMKSGIGRRMPQAKGYRRPCAKGLRKRVLKKTANAAKAGKRRPMCEGGLPKGGHERGDSESEFRGNCGKTKVAARSARRCERQLWWLQQKRETERSALTLGW